MSYLKNYINKKNESGEKVLSVFLTAGFPHKENFTDLVLAVFDAGADIVELGFPFSDPLADGFVIQLSSTEVLKNGVNLGFTLDQAKRIKEEINKPIVLMGYANSVLSYGINRFAEDAVEAGVSGVIIPDVPLDEYNDFFSEKFNLLDTILLTTPTSVDDRTIAIDKQSRGFLYYVSMTGTTGGKLDFNKYLIEPLKHTASLVKHNPLLVGFGISSAEDVKIFMPYCSGVIVGSAVIRTLMNDNNKYSNTLKLVRDLKLATYKLEAKS